MRRAVVFALLCAAFAASVPSAPARSATAVPDSVRADADWILQTRTPEGILANGIDKSWVVPYFANIGARGLARAYAVTGDMRYASAAWSWLSWYQSKMDSRGFVTDYVLRNGAWVSTGDMDSTDSYAATFLTAVRDIVAATGDVSRLMSVWQGVLKAVLAIEATTNADSLTQAKPTWAWRYLMDNAEVYEGWLAAADLAGVTADAALLSKSRSRASALASSLRVMAAPSRGGYDWGHMTNGARALLDWNQLYPSAVAQAWPVFAGLVTGSEAEGMMNRIDLHQPTWDEPYSTGRIGEGTAQILYWPDVARGFLAAGLTDRARQGYEDLERVADQHTRLWPFHPGIAGSLILLGTDLYGRNRRATAGPAQHTPTSPQAYPASTPTRHDYVYVSTAAADADDAPKVQLCRGGGVGTACTLMRKSAEGRYDSAQGDLPRKCAGQSLTYWIVVTDGESVTVTPPRSVRYEGDTALSLAFCRA